MEKIYKISNKPYGNITAVRTTVDYKKNQGGYVITAEFIEQLEFDNALFGKLFSKEYYQHNGDGVQLVVPCGRRSKKKQQEAEQIFTDISKECAEKFVENVNGILGTKTTIIE